MSSLVNNNLSKTLSGWLLAIALVAGFFSGYSGNFTSEPRHKSQTEWVSVKRNLQTRTFRISNKIKLAWAHYDFSALLFQNRLSQTLFTTNLKEQLSFSIPLYFVQTKHLPQVTTEDLLIS
jgi:hypothetical protein